jgi:hypothetical protein
MKRAVLLIVSALMAAGPSAVPIHSQTPAAQEARLLRFPAIHGNQVVFNAAQDIIPMWKGTKVYFASDRDEHGRMNLYWYDLGSKQTKKLTAFTEFDVKFPSMGDAAIVFENGGWIYKLDLATEQVVKVPVSIREDFDSGRASIVDVSRSITNYEVAPDGSGRSSGLAGTCSRSRPRPAPRGI